MHFKIKLTSIDIAGVEVPDTVIGVELIGVPLAESVEFASFADSTKLYLLSAFLFADIS